jgi:hypothetical protein
LFLRWGNNHDIGTRSNNWLRGLFRNALRGKDMLLALDGEDSPYLTENCLLKDTDTPVAEQVQKLFVLDKNNMASPESAESE